MMVDAVTIVVFRQSVSTLPFTALAAASCSSTRLAIQEPEVGTQDTGGIESNSASADGFWQEFAGVGAPLGGASG